MSEINKRYLKKVSPRNFDFSDVYHEFPLRILKNTPTFSALLHTHEGGRAYGGPPRGWELSVGNLLS